MEYKYEDIDKFLEKFNKVKTKFKRIRIHLKNSMWTDVKLHSNSKIELVFNEGLDLNVVDSKNKNVFGFEMRQVNGNFTRIIKDRNSGIIIKIRGFEIEIDF